MKTSLALCLVLAGTVLMAAPVISSQWHLSRVATYFEEHGAGSVLPEELKLRPFARIEWACFMAGAAMVMGGVCSGLKRRDIPSCL